MGGVEGQNMRGEGTALGHKKHVEGVAGCNEYADSSEG